MGVFDFILKRAHSPETPSAQPKPDLIKLSRRDRARLMLLCRFTRARVFDPAAYSYWKDALGESAEAAVGRMNRWDWLTRPPLEEIVESFFKVPELKGFLRERGLPVSGRKADLLARLLSADRERMASKVANVTSYVCTPDGKAIADDYCAKELEAQRQVDARCLEMVAKGDYRGAAAEVAEYSRQRVVFDNPIAISLGDEDQESLLRYTAGARPKILRDVSPEDWKAAQNAAVMMSLWGARSAKAWLPESFKGSSNLEPDVAVRMIEFAGRTRWDVHRMRRCGVKTVKVSGCGDSCPECQALNEIEYPVEKAPEVPHPTCTHPMGCRCVVIAERIF